jgi:hypothetical protein
MRRMRVATWGIPLLAAAGLVLVAPACSAAAAGSSPPYTDPNAAGYIGLCNQAGHQITGGNISTTPLAWRAVSSEAAPAPYNNADRTAILLAYQPQQGLLPGEWSGEALTASSRYTNPAHPMAAATGGDDSLEDFIGDFPPRWDGYVELRMYLGTEDAEVYSLHYPTLNIQVTGDTWHAVEGGSVNCDTGSAESIESILLPKTATAPPHSKAPASQKGGSAGATTRSDSHTRTSGSDATGSHVAAVGTAAATGSHDRATGVVADAPPGASHLPYGVAILAALLVLAASGLFIARRRRSASVPSMSGTTLPSVKER